jgi:hypothetical protein
LFFHLLVTVDNHDRRQGLDPELGGEGRFQVKVGNVEQVLSQRLLHARVRQHFLLHFLTVIAMFSGKEHHELLVLFFRVPHQAFVNRRR